MNESTVISKFPPSGYTRMNFAYERSEFYLEKIVAQKLKKKHNPKRTGDERTYGGNVLTCKAARKYRQAWRIYRHYSEIYCKIKGIPFYKE